MRHHQKVYYGHFMVVANYATMTAQTSSQLTSVTSLNLPPRATTRPCGDPEQERPVSYRDRVWAGYGP